MIIARYLARHIFRGSMLVLLILVSLSLFFALIAELDDIGRGQYGLTEMFKYLLFRIPGYLVDYMPLAVLLGSILTLGNLASQSEVIALQAAGLSLRQFIINVVLSVSVLAIAAFLMANLLVPFSEGRANQIRSSTITGNISSQSRRGVWIKDDNLLVFIERLFPNGSAENIDVLSMSPQGLLLRSIHAASGNITERGWLLENISTTNFTAKGTRVEASSAMLYPGNLTQTLLASLAIESQQMSLVELHTYIEFLKQNQLDYQSASLRFWQKLYAPLMIIIMGLLAIPFVLGSQRNKHAGQRIMIGILLGLSFVVLSRLLNQLGEQLRLAAYVNALLPSLVFGALTLWLINHKTKISNS